MLKRRQRRRTLLTKEEPLLFITCSQNEEYVKSIGGQINDSGSYNWNLGKNIGVHIGDSLAIVILSGYDSQLGYYRSIEHPSVTMGETDITSQTGVVYLTGAQNNRLEISISEVTDVVNINFQISNPK